MLISSTTPSLLCVESSLVSPGIFQEFAVASFQEQASHQDQESCIAQSMPPHCAIDSEEWWRNLFSHKQLLHHLENLKKNELFPQAKHQNHQKREENKEQSHQTREEGQDQSSLRASRGEESDQREETCHQDHKRGVEEFRLSINPCCHPPRTPRTPYTWVEGAIIVGAGPSGMATAACLQQLGITSSILLEKSDCIASLWQERTYDRLRLHLPKKFCELPLAPFPSHFPIYPAKQQFLDYLHDYARRFHIRPRFGEIVQSARFDQRLQLWRVQTMKINNPDLGNISSEGNLSTMEYVGRWIVVATGENAEARIPVEIPGMDLFAGKIRHSSVYKSGARFAGQRVLVVGAGNSGMEIAMDLVQHDARPSIVVRSPIHILPREMLGKSTFGVSVAMLKFLPLWLTDRLLLLYALLALGDTSRYGIRRPKTGPLEMKEKMGKTPVLDVGTLAHIKQGNIKVEPAIECFTASGCKFVNGEQHCYDAIVLATGYKPNVPKWLKDPHLNFSSDGFPSCGWRGQRGLYVAGLSRKGILGVSKDARLIAQDIFQSYTSSQIKQQQQQRKQRFQ
ncbi:probable indole-3-pyruvate monooxygenase YUCCA9 [Selaginella moellendorffii]|nr:probable indole-3-pyruvate monooxygenase YUCCA9 [Selaginella moellendorffii]|eukprot:XP_002965620.2 probable indole-3-pyruvate monooxygenase YUCCA9 [Selaginella moellendorffii]